MGKSTKNTDIGLESIYSDETATKKNKENTLAPYKLMSKNELESLVSDYIEDWHIDEDDLTEVRDYLSQFYATYTSPNPSMSFEALEHERFRLLVELYNITIESGHDPFVELGQQCANFIRHYRQVPAGEDLDEELDRWEKEAKYKPDIVCRLPEQTGKSRLLNDFIKLDELLSQESEDDKHIREMEAIQITARISSKKPENLTIDDTYKLLERDKATRYKRSVLPKEILDTFKNGTYSVVGRNYQEQLKEKGWHICDSKERNKYRVFVDVNQKRFLKEKVKGEGDDLSLSLKEVTTENKRAFIRTPSRSDDELFDGTAMFTIDTNGRMFLFGVDDDEDGLSYASVMNCEPVLFAGRVISTDEKFELHSSSKEYKTNQHMARLATHHLTFQAQIIDENAIALSAPVASTEQAKILGKKNDGNNTIDKVELTRAQPLNIPNLLAVKSDTSSAKFQKRYSKYEGVYWKNRPDVIFPSGISIPDELLHLSDTEQEEKLEQNKNIKEYIAERFDLTSADAIWHVETRDFEQLLGELRDNSFAYELENSAGENIILPEEGVEEEKLNQLTEYYYTRQTASKLFNELYDSTVKRINKRFKLNSPEDIWSLSDENFDKFCERVKKHFNAKTLAWLKSHYDLLSLTHKPNTDPNRGIDIALELYDQRSIDIIPEDVISQIYDNMFEQVMRKGKVIKTAEEVKLTFEEKAKERKFSTNGLDAIWYLGNIHYFKHFLRTLIDNQLLLTSQELEEFQERANLEGSTQKPEIFNRLIKKSNFPEEAPQSFEEEEFNVAKEAHDLIHARKDALIQHYYSRRHISNSPEANLENMMYGSFYCKAKEHPWTDNRLLIYAIFIITMTLLLLALTTFLLFSPHALALTAAASGFGLKVAAGYVSGFILGTLSGFGLAYTIDKLITPKPVKIQENKFNFERWPFYQLPDEKLKEINGEEIIPLRESELYL